MREERLYPVLIQLVAAGAQIEESHHAGRRYTLVAAHQRLSLSAALAVKLERDGYIRPLCRLSGKTLWVGKPAGGAT